MTASVVSNAWATYEKGATQQVPVSLDCVPPHVCARAASSHGTQRGGGATVTHARAHTHAHARTHARTHAQLMPHVNTRILAEGGLADFIRPMPNRTHRCDPGACTHA